MAKIGIPNIVGTVHFKTCVVSRNKFLSIKFKGYLDTEKSMKKLNKRKLRWILRRLKENELSTYQIARIQGVSSRWVRKLRKRYGYFPLSKVETGICGRPKKPVSYLERSTVRDIHRDMPMCAVKIEKYLKFNGMMHIPHNRIHEILISLGKVKKMNKKIRRKKWVRYERRHSNSLWHTDFCEIEGKQLISFIDDASRYIVGYGFFDNATTDNALTVLDDAIERNGLPKQVMTDHGTQFCSDEKKMYKFSETLRERGIQHIMARIKRPQSNGKIERWFGTLKRLYFHFGRDMDKAVRCYNGMFHLSIDTYPAEAYCQKRRHS